MKFFILYIYKPPLYIAIEEGNIDMIKFLLSCKKVEINSFCISKNIIFF